MAVSESYLQLVYVHLATIIPAFMIRTYLLARRKGTPMHRMLGRIYMLLMLSTAVITLLMLLPSPCVFPGLISIFSCITCCCC